MIRRANLLNVAETLDSRDFSFINPPLVAAPSTTITDLSGDARKLPDPSKTARPNMGIERIQTHQVFKVQKEKGLGGKPVFAPANDDSNRIRFVGNWANSKSSWGTYIRSTDSSDYVEVTFHGTGINMLTLFDTSPISLQCSIDGGTPFTYFSGANSVVTGNNGINQNIVLPVIKGLTNTTHTAKFSCSSADTTAHHFYGFEILGNPTAITVPQGEIVYQGSKFTNPTLQNLAYNTGFDGNPSLNGKGGKVSVYLQNGRLGKAIQQTNASTAYLGAADHSNEDGKEYHWRTFTNGRNDDFGSVTTSPGNKAFTLEDGVTTLFGQNVRAGAGDVLNPGSPGNDYVGLTFVGVGLDVVRRDDGNSLTNHSYAVYVDDVLVGNYTNAASTSPRIEKLVSGLPYGTHTVKLLNTASPVQNVAFESFIVYTPKKPTIPKDSVEVCSYDLVADFAQNTTQSAFKPSTGVIRQNAFRGVSYVGANWTISGPNPAAYTDGFIFYTNGSSGQTASLTFYGVGIELRSQSFGTNSSNISVEVDGVAPTSVSTYGNWTYSSGTLDQAATPNSSAGSGMSITGLPLDFHTIKLTNNTTGQMTIDTFDIITPIYSAKSSVNSYQNASEVGSNSLNFDFKLKGYNTTSKVAVSALGILVNPSTSSTTFVPMPDMTVRVSSKGGLFDISYISQATNNQATGAGSTHLQVFIDGEPIANPKTHDTPNGSSTIVTIVDKMTVFLPPGIHSVAVYWKAGAGISTAFLNQRTLLVTEL